jgi:acyl-CoA reductase-like NAD-dependent aldehyde dehydrogenase
MAGNIPLVGFFDMLCVVCAGQECLIKPSSKDSILMRYVVGLLHDISTEISVRELGEGEMPDAVIATGSDNTNRYFRSMYGNIPALLRGNRASAAILDGRESADELRGLASDIFSYSGLGCRNVSHLLVPEDYDVDTLAAILSDWHTDVNPKYVNNFRQRAALLEMEGDKFIRGRFFILRDDDDFPASISEITYHRYKTSDEAVKWLSANSYGLQCVVGHARTDYPVIGFGEAQRPGLNDYADNVDTMSFLSAL